MAWIVICTRSNVWTLKCYIVNPHFHPLIAKGLIRIRKSKDRQYNGQKKKDKRTNNDLQNMHIKLKIEQQPH
jgi:hypothetical protein